MSRTESPIFIINDNDSDIDSDEEFTINNDRDTSNTTITPARQQPLRRSTAVRIDYNQDSGPENETTESVYQENDHDRVAIALLRSFDEEVNRRSGLSNDTTSTTSTRSTVPIRKKKKKRKKKKSPIQYDDVLGFIEDLRMKTICGICAENEKNIVLLCCQYTSCLSCFQKNKHVCPYCREKNGYVNFKL